MLILTWFVFAIALFMTFALMVQCIGGICGAISNDDWKISAVQSLYPAIFGQYLAIW